MTLYALMSFGYREEASAWREWLMRAVAGIPAQMQTVYGVAGERRLPEYEIRDSRDMKDRFPVRIGNAASEQAQLEVYGEVIDLLFQARRLGVVGMDGVWMRIPAKANADSEGNANGIPGRRRTVFGA